MFKKIMATDNAASILLIRLMVGAVFLSEGLQKFLFPALRGAGRFESIGLPHPEFLGVLVGFFEIFCGMLILAGLATRLAAIPLIVIMATAIITTKAPMLSDQGFWQMLHAARTDYAMTLGSIFLLIRGSGAFSADRFFSRRPK